ncbi:hypothetical protein [Sorangium sp. So ce426]
MLPFESVPLGRGATALKAKVVPRPRGLGAKIAPATERRVRALA